MSFFKNVKNKKIIKTILLAVISFNLFMYQPSFASSDTKYKEPCKCITCSIGNQFEKTIDKTVGKIKDFSEHSNKFLEDNNGFKGLFIYGDWAIQDIFVSYFLKK